MRKKVVIFFMAAALGGWLAAQTVDFPFSSRIVFNSDFTGNSEIYLITDNQLTRLTTNAYADEWPVPDRAGGRIVYASKKYGNYDVFMMDLKTREITALTRTPLDEVDPSWSHDDRFVFYDQLQPGKSVTIKQNLQTGRSAPLFPDPPFKGTIVPFQTRSGDEIFFTGKIFLGWAVAKYNLKTATYSKLAERGSCRPKISPDDRTITYVSHEGDDLGDVWLMDPDGGNKRNLTDMRPTSYDYYPCYSPDGQQIVFSSSPQSAGKEGYDLYRIDIKSRKVALVFQSAGNDQFPYWF